MQTARAPIDEAPKSLRIIETPKTSGRRAWGMGVSLPQATRSLGSSPRSWIRWVRPQKHFGEFLVAKALLSSDISNIHHFSVREVLNCRRGKNSTGENDTFAPVSLASPQGGQRGALAPKPALHLILRFAQIRWEVCTLSGGDEASTVKTESHLCGYFLTIFNYKRDNIMRNKRGNMHSRAWF